MKKAPVQVRYLCTLRSRSMEAEPIQIAISITAAALVLLLLRVYWTLSEIQRHRRTQQTTQPQAKSPTLVVLGSGGHTTEMLFMTKRLDPSYSPIYYCKAETDTTSPDRLLHSLSDKTKLPTIYNIPRSREVGQSYISSVFTTLYSLGAALRLVWILRPRLILCNGPGTCLPVCLSALCFRIGFGRSCQIVFIESYCRVETLSLTGKILYFMADLFCVHWKQLHEDYPNSVLSSSFIQNND